MYDELGYMDPGHSYIGIENNEEKKPQKPQFDAPPIPTEQNVIKVIDVQTHVSSPADTMSKMPSTPRVFEGTPIYYAQNPNQTGVPKVCFATVAVFFVVSLIALGVVSVLYGIKNESTCDKDNIATISADTNKNKETKPGNKLDEFGSFIAKGVGLIDSLGKDLRQDARADQ